MEFPTSSRPTFMKLFFPDHSARQLQIPARVRITLPETVILRDKFKNIWQVKAKKIDNHWYFLDWWAKFAQDNSLNPMDMLAFDYICLGTFDVKLFEEDGCDKVVVGYRKCINTQEHENMENGSDDGSEDYAFMARDDSRSDEDTLVVVSSRKNKKIEYYDSTKGKGKIIEVAGYQEETEEYETGCNTRHGRQDYNWDEDEYSEDDNAFQFVHPKNNKGKEPSHGLKRARDDIASGSRKPGQKKRNVDGIFKVGLASKPKSSYRGRRMKPLLTNELRGIWNETSEEAESEKESLELIQRHTKKGKERAKELRADVRDHYTAAVSGNPNRKRRNVDCSGKQVIVSRSTPRPKNPSSTEKMPPSRINGLDRGKRILNESSDDDSENSAYRVISPEEFKSKVFNKGQFKCEETKSKSGDVNATRSTKAHRRNKVDWLGKEIFESGLAPLPKCPYFVTKMKPKRMNELYIPKDLLMDENLALPEEMKLVDPSGRTYTTKLITWSCGRTFYKGGLNRLYRRNEVGKEDFCICEFGEGGAAGYLFISFVRTYHQ